MQRAKGYRLASVGQLTAEYERVTYPCFLKVMSKEAHTGVQPSGEDLFIH